MDKVLDSKGWQIVEGARIRVRMPTGVKCQGIVVGVEPDAINYRNVKTHGLGTAKPEWTTVMKGSTRASVNYKREVAVLQGLPIPRRPR